MAATKKATQVRRRKELKKVDRGQAHIQSSFNNTLVTITDMNAARALWRRAPPKSTGCVPSKSM